MREFNDWFPTSQHGTTTLNTKDFGAIADGLAHSMSALGFSSVYNAQNGIGGNGIAYPECTDINDTADWCALQAAINAGMNPATAPYGNRAIYVPSGWYITRKPLMLPAIYGAKIFGDGNGASRIQNETTGGTTITMNGLSAANFKGLSIFATGSGSIAFDMYWDGTATGAPLNGCVFEHVVFSAPGGVGIYLGRGYMGSEMVFISTGCTNCDIGFLIDNYNALNYTFINSGAAECTSAGVRINTGGNCYFLTTGFANNGVDVVCYTTSSNCMINTRTESAHFIQGGNWSIIGCTQGFVGPSTFLNGGKANIQSSGSYFGKIISTHAPVQVSIDNCDFNSYQYNLTVTAITNNGSGEIRLTHTPLNCFVTGDEVIVHNVGGLPAADGIWIITKISDSQVDLIGSIYAAGFTSGGFIGPGPHNHLKDTVRSVVNETTSRELCESHRKSFALKHTYSGTQYDNKGATAEVVFTLPDTGAVDDYKGCRFRFCVHAAQNLKIIPGTASTTIYDGTATGTTHLQSSTVGSVVELVYMDGAGAPFEPSPTTTPRWYVVAKTGTWTLA